MEEFVRPAAERDVDELTVLEAEYRTALAAGVRGGEEWLRDVPQIGPAGWHERLNHTDHLVLVAGVDDSILGVVVAEFPARISASASVPAVASVRMVYVTPGARELGLGDAMIAAVLTWATSQGADSLEAVALPGDRQTKNLFERSGLVARLITVSRRLR